MTEKSKAKAATEEIEATLVEEVREKVRASAEEVREKVREDIRAGAEDLSERARDGIKDLEELIKEHPVQSTLIAFGLGFVLSRLLSR